MHDLTPAVVLSLFLAILGPVSVYAQGASYDDAINKERRRFFHPDGRLRSVPLPREEDEEPEPPTLERAPKLNLFNRWTPAKIPPPLFSFHADAAFTGRNVSYIKRKERETPVGLDGFLEFVAGLPPPPPKANYNKNTLILPPNLDPYYAPILQFIQSGPGPGGVGTLGNLITLDTLRSLTPHLLALLPLFNANNLTLNQFYALLATPQGQAAYAAVYSILQPLGMWNVSTLNAWYSYVLANSTQVRNILTTFYYQLLAAVPQVVTNTTITYTSVNPFVIIAKMNELWQKGDLLKIAEAYPRLAHTLTKHLGWDLPMGVLYGRDYDGKFVWPYSVGVIAEQRTSKERNVYVLNEDGFFVNDSLSGSGRWYQGPYDISMVYLPFEIRNKSIRTLDVVASDEYALWKRISGGDVRLLDRASTFSTAVANVDVALFEDRWLHLRPFAGATTYMSIGGLAAKAEVDLDLFRGHLAGGAGVKRPNYLNKDIFSSYLETELYVRTPYLEYQNKVNGIRCWGSLTVAAAAMAQKSVRWSLQAEARLIPEIHAQLVTNRFSVRVTGGMTAALVPGGQVDLTFPERTLGVHPIRRHVECELLIDALVALVRAATVLEVSELSQKSRSSVGLTEGEFTIMAILETERYKNSEFLDVSVGGSTSFSGLTLTALKSIKDDDYRVEAGLDLSF